jgi:hypothetical protein
MIYEIRNYHFDPDRVDGYKTWAKERAIPYLSSRVDVVGFWADCGIEAEVRGQPLDALGPATVTWVIRWGSHEQRQSELPGILASDEWKGIFSQVPGGPESYRRIECRFFAAVE